VGAAILTLRSGPPGTAPCGADSNTVQRRKALPLHPAQNVQRNQPRQSSWQVPDRFVAYQSDGEHGL